MRTDITMQKKQNNSYLSNSTKFTLCVYWDVRPDGVPYTHADKLVKANRKYIDSYDFVNTKDNKTITDHYEAYWKLVIYCQKNISKIGNAVLYCNDFVNQKQYKIAVLSKIPENCRQVLPLFTKIENPYGSDHIYLDGFQSPVLDTFDLVQRVLTKNPINVKQLNH